MAIVNFLGQVLLKLITVRFLFLSLPVVVAALQNITAITSRRPLPSHSLKSCSTGVKGKYRCCPVVPGAHSTSLLYFNAKELFMIGNAAYRHMRKTSPQQQRGKLIHL